MAYVMAYTPEANGLDASVFAEYDLCEPWKK
jgi:hypothetical protein